jgi:DNA helicase II / ATP-dependent DNA helicase PcrA
MKNVDLENALAGLTAIQKEAVEFSGGALLVLAGPGSGKTQVLTCRIAKLLADSPEKNFRVLALTFTNKAADEMKSRVSLFVPGNEERANIGTFHSFCAQMLRQHGVHMGIQPDFTIYSQDEDRKAVLEEAVKNAKLPEVSYGADDSRFLVLIDKLKSRLIGPDKAGEALKKLSEVERAVAVYQLYEDELRRVNALDFNSLIFEAHRLITTYPAIAARYRKSHPYWLVDEFQDTNHAQYSLLKALAGSEFRNIFAVADDDQIIYQWNGASFRNMQKFTADFAARSIQLPTNYRCPPAIVAAANNLVAYNAERTSQKAPLLAGKKKLQLPAEQHVKLLFFEDEDEEAAGIASEIAKSPKNVWSETAVLARTKALLERIRAEMQKVGVASIIAQRRDDFLSPEFRWFVTFLKQVVRPLDKRNMAVLIDSFNRIAGNKGAGDQVLVEAEAEGQSYLSTWFESVASARTSPSLAPLISFAEPLLKGPQEFRKVAEDFVTEYEKRSADKTQSSDLAEDVAAWKEISREIGGNVGKAIPLDQFLQELQLRSKEPSPKGQTVRLMTIHAAKGREFDFVYLVGLAESVLPSYQSIQKGDASPEMEEERRNCFVAITRTKECLVMSHAKRYRGWAKEPSRFLHEMGFV